MKVIIAGSRTITDPKAVIDAIEQSSLTITQVISGTAAGVDRLGERWAESHNIRIRRFPADWKRHGKAAGRIRNLRMLQYADALIAVYDGRSRGTRHMIEIALKKGLPTVIHYPDGGITPIGQTGVSIVQSEAGCTILPDHLTFFSHRSSRPSGPESEILRTPDGAPIAAVRGNPTLKVNAEQRAQQYAASHVSTRPDPVCWREENPAAS